MSDISVNNFDVWKNNVPIVIIGTDGEFDVWREETPVEDVDTDVTRRRVFEF